MLIISQIENIRYLRQSKRVAENLLFVADVRTFSSASINRGTYPRIWIVSALREQQCGRIEINF